MSARYSAAKLLPGGFRPAAVACRDAGGRRRSPPWRAEGAAASDASAHCRALQGASR